MSVGILASLKAQWAQKQADKRAKAHSDEIDNQIHEDSKNFQKVLLMGHNERDISTMVRQMKMTHRNGYTHEERIRFRPTILKNLLETSCSVVQVLRGLRTEAPGTLASEAHWERIMDHPTTVDGGKLKPKLAEAVRSLWTDDMIPVLLDSPSRFPLPDDATYFFSEARRITARDYIPSNEDILRAPARTDVGITETYFKIGQRSLRLSHVSGLKGCREKWIHLFESVTSIIFCAPLADYDQVDADGRNQLGESLIYFGSVINSRWFLHAPIILFLTGIDKFKNKLPKVPLDKCFPEYTGGSDVNQALKYILWRFAQANRTRLNVYPHITRDTDTPNIRLVFVTVKKNYPSTCAWRERYKGD